MIFFFGIEGAKQESPRCENKPILVKCVQVGN
jgi:hypothetical protein